jgi:hypothetical protein
MTEQEHFTIAPLPSLPTAYAKQKVPKVMELLVERTTDPKPDLIGLAIGWQ